MEEFNISEFLQYYLSSILIVILTTVIGLVASFIYTSYVQVPLYQSQTSIVLTKSDGTTSVTQNDVSLNKNLVSTYREIIKSRRILSEVINDLKLDIKTEKLSGRISVASVNDTELIVISVLDEDANIASDIANQIAIVFKEQITSIYNIENVSIVDEAIPTEKPANVNVKKQYLLGIGGGFFLGTLIIFILFYFDDTIKMSDELEQKLGLSVFYAK